MCDTAVDGSHIVELAITNPCVSIARATVCHTSEITGDSFLSVRTQSVNGGWNRLLVACFDFQNVADEAVLFSVIPDNFRFSAWYPLQHTDLLPVPCPSGPQWNPTILFMEIDHPYFDHIVRSGRSMLKANFIAKDKAIVR